MVDKPMIGSSQPLEIIVDDEVLTIRIGVSTLADATERSPANDFYDENSRDFRPRFIVRRPYEFAQDVRIAMRDEGEDGSTPLTRFLDAVCLSAIEAGSDAVDEIRYIVENNNTLSQNPPKKGDSSKTVFIPEWGLPRSSPD